MRARFLAILLAAPGLASAGIGAADELPDDEFLEFLGVWDEAWTQACDADGGLPGDDVCLQREDDAEDEDDEADDEN